MVGQLIRLKLRIIWNTVRRQTAVLVLAALGVLYFGGIYASVLVGAAFLARSDEADLATPFLPIVGPVVVVLWLILPIAFASMDNSLDPVRLSPYVGPSKRLGAALVGAPSGLRPSGGYSQVSSPFLSRSCGRVRSAPGSRCAWIARARRTPSRCSALSPFSWC